LRRALARWLLGLALFGVLLLTVARAAAHDLAIDQVTLFPNRALGTLRGQVTFDPALTRAPGERALSGELEARAVAFAQKNLAIEVDGRPLALSLKVRELWVRAGATLGDTIMLDAKLPPSARELVVRVGGGFRALVVSVEETRAADAGVGLHSALVLGGDASPSYRFAGPLEREWKSGSASQFDALGLAHADVPPSDAGVPAPPSSPSERSAAAPPTDAGGFEAPSTFDVARQYVGLGLVHIVPGGLDHVLFVLGLVLGAGRRVRRLVLLLSLFTIAHTVTLALGALGWVVLSGSVVEPLIALSIAFVGVENALTLRKGRAGAPSAMKYRPFVVLAFGLLHGLGFAGALSEAGIARETFVVSLLSFNVGVELGQLLVAVVGLGVVALSAQWPEGEITLARRGSLLIALVGLGWTVTRVVA
jgi:hypothetical protein